MYVCLFVLDVCLFVLDVCLFVLDVCLFVLDVCLFDDAGFYFFHFYFRQEKLENKM